MSQTVGEIGEVQLLERIMRITGRGPEDMPVPNGDDAAVLPARGRLVVSTDATVENVHYHADRTPPDAVAWKALASALSDLAAKAADPYAVLITLAMPPSTPVDWVNALYRTFAERGETWSAPVVGGDVVSAPVVMIDVVAMGWLRTAEPIRLDGARPGDAILVTGTVGASRLGLLTMDGGQPAGIPQEILDRSREAFLRPEPRLQTSRAITELVTPTSMTDVSDGLAKDLPKLARAGGVGFKVDLEALPVPIDRADVRQESWRGGEDYELLFTIPGNQCQRLIDNWEYETPITRIGSILPSEEGMTVAGLSGTVAGYDHFSRE